MKLRFIKNRPSHIERKTIASLILPAILTASLLVTSHLAADARYRVKLSDNLNQIVSRQYVNSDLTKSQLMVAILARNPRAFKGGNINFLMRGRRLVLPSEENIQVVSDDEAKAILREHASYFRRGITGNLSLPDYSGSSDSDREISRSSENKTGYKLSNNDLEALNTQYLNQQDKLKELEADREKLRKQLEKLTAEKKQSDAQLEQLEVKFNDNAKRKNGTFKEREKSQQALHENVLSEGKKKRMLEEHVSERTKKLNESNSYLQKKLQETRSELAENTRENISLERQLGNLKGDKPQQNSSVAKEIGAAKYTTEILDDSSGSVLGKFAWLLPVLALFAALWFLLRYFLGGRQNGVGSNESETYATPAFESGDAFDEDYEEVSLETSIKLDVARAYIEADDLSAANEILQEVIDEGSVEQQQEAIELMAKL